MILVPVAAAKNTKNAAVNNFTGFKIIKIMDLG